MNIKRFNGNDFPGDKWVRDILTRVNEIVDYLKLKVTRDRLSNDVTSVLSPITTKGDLVVGGTNGVTQRLAVGTDGQVLTSDGTTAAWESLPTATASQRGVLSLTSAFGATANQYGMIVGGKVPGNTSGSFSSTGYIGERVSSVQILNSVAATGGAMPAVTARRITLQKGIYLVSGSVTISGFSGNPGLFETYLGGTITVVGQSFQDVYVAGNLITTNGLATIVLATADNQTVDINARTNGGSSLGGTITVSSSFDAVRIA